MTPTQRSLAKLRKEGYLCAVVEHWNHHVKIRQDLFGCIDILAIKASHTLAVQTTTDSGLSARLNKTKALLSAYVWLSSPYRQFVFHGWGRKGARGKRKLWQCREVKLRMIDCVPIDPPNATTD